MKRFGASCESKGQAALKQKVSEASGIVAGIEDNNSWSCHHEKCKMKFKSLEEKLNHEKVHEFACSNCSKHFKSEQSLFAHFNDSHTKPVDTSKPECPRCSKKFKTKEILFTHFHAAHTKDPKPFECVRCPGKICNKIDLSQHLGDVHSLIEGYRRLLCEFSNL